MHELRLGVKFWQPLPNRGGRALASPAGDVLFLNSSEKKQGKWPSDEILNAKPPRGSRSVYALCCFH